MSATWGPAGGVRSVNPLDDRAWDASLPAMPGASFFHGSPWIRVLRDTYGFKPCFFVDGSTAPRSIVPAMEVDSWLTGRRGIALPFTDESPPLCENPAGFQGFFAAVVEQARSRRWKYIECRGGRALFGEAPASTTFYGHQLDLQSGPHKLFSQFDEATRRAVRKAEKSGLTISVSQEMTAIREFYRLLCQTRRKHGLPAQPFRFYAKIHEHVLARNHGRVFLAHLGSAPVAGAVFFHFGGCALYKFGASDETRQHFRANNLVMGEAIKWHSERGFKMLDFGRTSLENAGLRRYKLGWGAAERTVEYVRYDLRANSFVTAHDGASGWHNRLFRALPISLSRLAGSLLYKHAA